MTSKPSGITRQALFCAALFFAALSLYSPCRASPADRARITGLDLSQDEGLLTLEACLSQEDLLNHFQIIGKLEAFSYEELLALKERCAAAGRAPQLSRLIAEVSGKKEKEGLYLLQEEIFIDNHPLSEEHPFYGTERNSYSITRLDPSAEYLYFNNLKLKYRKNGLIKRTAALWEGDNNPASGEVYRRQTDAGDAFAQALPRAARKLWTYRLRQDNLTDYLVSLRQWIKRYEESALYPAVYREVALLRNAYRLFCIDLHSGKELWSFGVSGGDCQETRQLLKAPHHNMYGYQLLLDRGEVFAELGGKLTALRLKGTSSPALLWEQDLGEYSLCTKPLLSGGVLIAGLINAKGELWVAGFSREKGMLKWNTYVGICSFLSPPCGLSALAEKTVLLGTNHGVLISLDPDSGKIRWLKKYRPRNYSLLDYWQQTHSTEMNLIRYDTQFLEALGDSLYYKPRESGYLHILLPQNGETEEDIPIGQGGCYILGVCAGKALLLDKADDTAQGPRLKVIDLDSGRKLYALNIGRGELKGAVFRGENEIVFKAGEQLYFIRLGSGEPVHAAVKTGSKEGWLLSAAGDLVFIAEGRDLSCLDISAGKSSPDAESLAHAAYLRQREEARIDLVKALRMDPDNRGAGVLIAHLTEAAGIFSLQDIFPVIASSLEQLRRPEWKGFIVRLAELRGGEIVTYRDVELKFKVFLGAAGLLPEIFMQENKPSVMRAESASSLAKELRARGDRVFLLPVKVAKGTQLPDFFLLLNRDQLLCVDEKGMIRWASKVFFRTYPVVNYNVDYATDKAKGRMYADDIEAYLYGDTVIVNDHVNITAFNAADGSWVWGMTNKGGAFDRGRQYPPFKTDALYKKYGLDRSFLKEVMLYSLFLDDKAIIVHGNKLYSVDPLTGYCRLYRELDMESVIEAKVADGKIYLVSALLDKLEVLDDKLNLLYAMPLDFVKEKNAAPQLFFCGRYVALRSSEDLYLIDTESRRLKNAMRISNLDNAGLEVFGGGLLVIEPFTRITSYRLLDGTLSPGWGFAAGSIDPEAAWQHKERRAQVYFLSGGSVIMPFRRNGDFFCARVDLKDGRCIWEKPLSGIRGFFYDMSGCNEYRGGVNFILTTGCEEIFTEEFGYCKDAISIYFSSKLCTLDLATGNMIRKEKMPSLCVERIIMRSGLTETRHALIYVMDAKFIIIEKKQS